MMSVGNGLFIPGGTYHFSLTFGVSLARLAKQSQSIFAAGCHYYRIGKVGTSIQRCISERKKCLCPFILNIISA